MVIFTIFAAPEAKPAQKKKKGKQTTLLKSPSEKENTATDKKVLPEKNAAPNKKYVITHRAHTHPPQLLPSQPPT